MRTKIALDMQIEELVQLFPEAVGFLTRRGLRCIRCGEPIWGTLEEFFQGENVEDPHKLIDELNAYILERKKETG